MKSSLKRRLPLFGFLISILFLGLAFRGIAWEEWFDQVRSVKTGFLLTATLLNGAAILLKAARWQLILRPFEKVALIETFKATCIGLMGNNIFPFKAGELIRVFVLARRIRVRRTTLVSTAVTERIVEAISFLILFPLLVWLTPVPGWLRYGVGILGAITLTVFTLLYLLAHWGKGREELFRSRHLAEFLNGLEPLRRVEIFLPALALALIGWFVQGGVVWLAARSVGLPLEPSVALFVLVAVNLSVVIPAAAGHIGTFEYAIWLALQFFAVPKALALGFAVVYHLLQWVPVTLAGWILMIRIGMKVKELQAEED